MRRRTFVTLLGASAAAWPRATPAQRPAVPVLGILQTGSSGGANPSLAALLEGLAEGGFVDGRNLTIEYRYAEGQSGRLPALAADLVRRGVTVIAGLGGSAPALAAKAVTTIVPIVFAAPQNVVELGLVDSFERPGGNVTGIVGDHDALTARRLELLHELVRDAPALAVLVNPGVPTAVESIVTVARSAAEALGLRLHVVGAASERGLDEAFLQLAQQRAQALLIGADVAFFNWRHQIVALAARYQIPAAYWRRDFVAGGGLTSYGANFEDLYRQAGLYIGRILNGEKPSNLPVLQPAKLEFVLNRKVADALGLALPLTLLARADEVIE